MNRRTFLATVGSGAALLSIDSLLASPYRRFLTQVTEPQVKITGKVSVLGSGLKGVVVSDGVVCAQTGSDGTFQLLSPGYTPFVFITVPRGYRIPKLGNGTAAHWQLVQPDNNSISAHIFSLEPEPEVITDYRFVALADPQILDAEDMNRFHNETIPDINSFAGDASFGVSVGDIMFDHLELYPEYISGIGKTGMPFFQVVGNHDVDTESGSDDNSVKTFGKHFGPHHYSFNAGDVHYIVLDSVLTREKDYIGYLTEVQLNWMQSDLRFVERGSSVVVFMHIPPYTSRHIRNNKPKPTDTYAVANRQELYRLLEGYRSTIICGHTHESDLLSDGGCAIHTLGTTCGAWWTGDICYDGTPNGYGYYTVKGSDISLLYKATGKPAEYQCRSYGQDKNGVLAVNIWSATAEDVVVLFDGSENIGVMKPVTGRDPLAAELFTGKDKPAKHGWVEPVTQTHLFTLPVQKPLTAGTIELRKPKGTLLMKI